MKAGRRALVASLMVAACGSATPSAAPQTAESPSEVAASAHPTTPLANASLAPAASVIPTLPATPSPTAEPSAPPPRPTATPSDEYGRWDSAGELSGYPLQTHVVAFGKRALVVGSDNVCTPGAAFPESSRVQIFGGDERWDAAPSLARARDRFLALSLPDGSVLVVGGLTDSQGGPKSFRSTYRLKPGALEWVRSGDLNSARSGPAGSVLKDGRILVAGGWYSDMPDAPPVLVIASAELFDPATGRWSRTGSLARARLGASAATLSDGRVLIAGGWGDIPRDVEGPYGFSDELASAEIFDPATGTFSETGSLPWPASWASLIPLADGGALIVSGYRAARFDVATGQWAETPPMHLRGDAHFYSSWVRTAVPLPGGEVLVAGGFVETDDNEEGSTKPFSKRAEVYDPAAGEWTEITRMPVGRVGAAGVRLGDGSVLIAGGAGVVGALGAPYCPGAALEAVRFIPS